MKPISFVVLTATVLIVSLVTSPGAVFLDEDWDDGDRTDTNLPEESAWFGSTAANAATLEASPGGLTGNVRMFETNTSSRLWLTHFTPAGTPAELIEVGDTFRATLVFSASNITAASTTSRGLRIGLFNFSEAGATRVSADGFSTGTGVGAPGAAVSGYMLNMNFAQAFTINNPIEVMKRTDTNSVNLLGATAVFTRVGTTGGGPMDTPGFSNEVLYTLEVLIRRHESSVDITATFSDLDGWRISHTVTDSISPNLRFDTLAIRPNSAPDTADSFTFTRFKVETFPFAPRITAMTFIPDQFTLRISWDALPGKTYELEWRPNVDPGTWTSLGTVTATQATASLEDPDALFRDQAFYRVVQMP
jgi:hypothetical protein